MAAALKAAAKAATVGGPTAPPPLSGKASLAPPLTMAAALKAAAKAATKATPSGTTNGAKAKNSSQNNPKASVPLPPAASKSKTRTVQPAAAAAPASLPGLLQPTLLIPLEPPVLGLDELQVLVVQLADVSPKHQTWLLQGWSGKHKPPSPTSPQQQHLEPEPPKVIGFDTEFIGDQLALVQLCCGDRALLVRVPQQRSAASGTGGSNKGGSNKGSKGSKGSKAGGAVIVGGGSNNTKFAASFPFIWPSWLQSQLCDPSLPKAGAEVWQDALMMFATFGVKLRGGLDLTAAFTLPTDDDGADGKNDLNLPSLEELALAAQWVLTYQFQEAGEPRRTKHDFTEANFKQTKKQELVLAVRMARFNTRLRRGYWVEMRLAAPDGRQLVGRCMDQAGKCATVGKLRWGGAGGNAVKWGEVAHLGVQSIEMEEAGETPEEAACSKLLSEVNDSQRAAIEAILCGGPQGGGGAAGGGGGGVSAVHLVQGPPGTGKTTVISHTVSLWVRVISPFLPPLPGAGRAKEAVACVARSNVAAKNIALSLLKRGLGAKDFRRVERGCVHTRVCMLVVSRDYHFEWHEEQYKGALEAVLLTSDQLGQGDLSRKLEDVKVFVTTVSMLSNPNFESNALYGKGLTRLMVDEASQIYAGDLVLPLVRYGNHLRSLSLFGDDVQLPPYGSEWDGAQLHSLFDHLTPPAERALARLRPQPNAFTVGPQLAAPRGSGGGDGGAQRIMLSVSYRLPALLCNFVSQALYGGVLTPPGLDGGGGHRTRASRPILWVDVEGKEEKRGSSSYENREEVRQVVRLVTSNPEIQRNSWTVITGTFQGREDEVIIASLVRSEKKLGFMKDDRRVNVMLTRCTRQLVVVGRLSLALSHPATLIGRLAAFCVQQGLVVRPPKAPQLPQLPRPPRPRAVA
ncbi:hypothetical protein VOLCADRAFT_98869 [Volvox carteri f. nagariensis]|uniref:DNA2/NAM7 helicase-like C-terminal domain-containing protein n=1 Tax=Volvox carteri f. nagariensis TaxID=3068 RepID=D8UGH8_VOLCA|nr:uncharacterized protein VOLCADRAFT_98869 [Volvox carteri f. nagariensis]EFJ41177.1 hypothetical protein VOLCADRAFT_98869 [Volvox carteri f. nagariensis]|eukprot:XP_002957745.1 hypothetical protein VOLCADRAFT_98869 [Volvox carteri f. nagariensis]